MGLIGEYADHAGLGGIDALATGIALLDPTLRFVRVNPAFCTMTGVGAARLLRHPVTVLYAEARLAEAARRVIERPGTLRLDGLTVCATPRSQRALDVEVSNDCGHVLLEARHAAAARPPAPVSESLRGFAHEVRNPLAAISGAAQLLQQRAADAGQRELATLVRDEAARLAALAERLLGARGTLSARAVNVHAMLERVAELLDAEHAPVTIVRDYDPSLPAWHGDPDRLLQALLNLVRNAVEANARRIVLRSRAEAGWRDAYDRRVPALRIEVEDDGHGVPPGLEAGLFEPMVSGRADGTGLGLALAREIVRGHGGELTYQRCEPGSRFALLLPRHARAPGDGP